MISVLVNGSPTKEFKMGRGLRQGDPLSPFLFLIVAEAFSMMLKKAIGMGKFKGYKFDEGDERFSHLQYADDTLIICEKLWSNIWTIKGLILLFESMSGLKVNYLKSSLVGINVSQHWIMEAANILNCGISSLPLSYLGLPIGENSKRLDTWSQVINTVKTRLSSWKNKHLSIGGRIVILKSVLFAIPVYFLSFFKIPPGIIFKLESIFKQFLWGGSEIERKINWVSWEKVCRPIEAGGLGIRNLGLFNTALLGKWKWKIRAGKKGIWFSALENRYGSNVEALRSGNNGSSRWWKDICDLNLDSIEESRDYSVKEAYNTLMPEPGSDVRIAWSKLWNKAIPTKVSCLAWRLVQNKIATKDNLVRRGVLLQGQERCAGECGREENVSHLFFECHCFAGVWSHICRWIGVDAALHSEAWQHLLQFENLLGEGNLSTLKLRVLWCACIWGIWKARNNKIFRNEEIQIARVTEETKVYAWRWLKIKSKLINDEFSLWCLNPKACLGHGIG
ncbi:uncharacterized protein LOC131649001 [Vicia villosa]|uniref:uncharacterized protein LOC131649001 n=1 Tax=Vicia villosa TaxID=3911 RepID=UPI00273C54A6|nr:uncharacterized protein LOC131649001 [Vicia villosa]